MPKKGFTGIIDLASNREDIQTQKLDTSSKNEVSSMPSYPQNSTKVAENTHKTVPQNKENAASKIPEHGEKNGSGAKDIFLIFLAMLAIIIGVYWYSTSDYAAWKEALSQDSLAGYRKYVSVKVDGAHVKEANAHIKEIQNQMLSRIVPPYNKKDIVGFLKDFPDFDTNKLEDDVVNDMVSAYFVVEYLLFCLKQARSAGNSDSLKCR